MKDKKRAMSGLVGEALRGLAEDFSEEIVLVEAYVGIMIWFVGDFSLVQKNLSSMIKNVASSPGKKGDRIIVKTGIMDGQLSCLKECQSQQAFEEGHYVFLEVARSGLQAGPIRERELFYPFSSMKSFKGYCLASPGIRGIQEIVQEALHVVSSGRGDQTFLRMLIPIKEDLENEALASAI